MMVFRIHCRRLGWVELGLVGESDGGCGEGREEGRKGELGLMGMVWG